MAFATTEDLADFLGRDEFNAAEEKRAELLLELASNTIINYCNRLSFTEDEPVPTIVKLVNLEVAKRGFSNPEGYSQRSVGDVNVSFSSAIASAGMFLTLAEQKALNPYRFRSHT